MSFNLVYRSEEGLKGLTSRLEILDEDITFDSKLFNEPRQV